MLINKHDFLIFGKYIQGTIFDLDVNRDNIIDFQFYAAISGSAAVKWYVANLKSIGPNNMIYGYIRPDATFFREFRTISKDVNNKIIVNDTVYNSCSRNSPNDIISKIDPNQLRLTPLMSGDSIQINDYYQADTISLTDSGFEIRFLNNNAPSADTIRNFFKKVNFSCNNYPQKQLCYIGIKIKDGLTEKLGWIAIKVDGFQILLIESAIQK